MELELDLRRLVGWKPYQLTEDKGAWKTSTADCLAANWQTDKIDNWQPMAFRFLTDLIDHLDSVPGAGQAEDGITSSTVCPTNETGRSAMSATGALIGSSPCLSY